MNKKIAIVTDGVWRKSLSVIRALGKDKYFIYVMGDSWLTTGFWSKYTSMRIKCKTAEEDENAFGEKIFNLIFDLNKKNIKPIIFPMEDATIKWLSKNEDKLKDSAYFLIPDKKSLEIAGDKNKTMLFAKKLKIPHPRTWFFTSKKELIEIIKTLKDNYEYVIKPIESQGSRGIIYTNKKKLLEFNPFPYLREYKSALIQERISEEGEAIGVSILMDEKNECRAFFVHKRLQQYPNTGGPSTDRISIENKNLVDLSIRLLRSLNWKGVVMVEWKVDPKDKIPKLLEINPRFWGSLELAVRSGVNFPILYAKAAKNEEFSNIFNYKLGVRCRWLIPGEILRFLTQKKEKRKSLLTFLKGLPYQAEEWDLKDLPGFIATIVCQFLLVLNPKYWKYLKR